MSAMSSPLEPLGLSLFVAVWTAGMAAMMFPAISPVVLLYSRIIRNNSSGSATIMEEDQGGRYATKMALFIGSYLVVWAATGLGLLLLWTIPVNAAVSGFDSTSMNALYGAILIVAGLYQFGPLKSRCLGYCESPMSLFMRRWKSGAKGAITLGTYHGLYCLGCCWPYFLIMVALGWMDIIWMALFAGIIFGEKMWSKGVWVARVAGVCLTAAGALATAGFIDIASVSDSSMEMPEQESMSGNLSTETMSNEMTEGQADDGGRNGIEMEDGMRGMT